MPNEVIEILRLPFEALRTVYEGACEVRLYRNSVTGIYEVGKRVDTLGLEGSMMVREATWLSNIRHRHIVPVQSVAEVDSPDIPPPLRVIEMMMPYYPKGSIADAFIRGEEFSVGEARDHALATLRGLGELHEVQRVLHRDIKASNLILTADANLVRIADLGIAAPFEDDGTVEAFPSPQLYSPPEAFVTNRLDCRSDLYSCGLVLFELLNGPLPWAEYEDRNAMLERLTSGKPAFQPRHLRFSPAIPPALRRLITKATAADPSSRPESAAVMADRLANAPLIDWKRVELSRDHVVWEGGSATRVDRTYRVEATSTKSGWELKGLQKVKKWQRVTSDAVVTSLGGNQPRAFFDHMVELATSR